MSDFLFQRISDFLFNIVGFSFQILDSKFWILDSKCWFLDSKFQIEDFNPRLGLTLVLKLRFRPYILGPRFFLLNWLA